VRPLNERLLLLDQKGYFLLQKPNGNSFRFNALDQIPYGGILGDFKALRFFRSARLNIDINFIHIFCIFPFEPHDSAILNAIYLRDTGCQPIILRNILLASGRHLGKS